MESNSYQKWKWNLKFVHGAAYQVDCISLAHTQVLPSIPCPEEVEEVEWSPIAVLTCLYAPDLNTTAHKRVFIWGFGNIWKLSPEP